MLPVLVVGKISSSQHYAAFMTSRCSSTVPTTRANLCYLERDGIGCSGGRIHHDLRPQLLGNSGRLR